MTFCLGSLSHIISKVHNNSDIQGRYPLKPLKENNSSAFSPLPSPLPSRERDMVFILYFTLFRKLIQYLLSKYYLLCITVTKIFVIEIV